MTHSDPTRHRSQDTKAFTLIEVVAALSVMLLLVGGVYGIASGALVLARSSQASIASELQLINLDTLMRSSLENLPPRAELVLSVDGERNQAVFAIRQAPGAFTWGPSLSAADTVFLTTTPGSRRDRSSRLILEHWTYGGSRPRSLGRLNLLENVIALRWRFFDETSGLWDDSWSREQGRPLLVELELRTVQSPEKQRFVYWIPRLDQPGPNALAGSASTERPVR